MADRLGLDGTMLHHLAVRKAMVSIHKPVHSKITLTYLLTWQADRCTSWRMAFKARPFPSLCSSFLCAYCSKKLPEQAPTKKAATCTVDSLSTTCVGTLTIRLCSIKSSLTFSLPYVTHVINYSRPSPAFLYWKRRKAGRGLGTRLGPAPCDKKCCSEHQTLFPLFGGGVWAQD